MKTLYNDDEMVYSFLMRFGLEFGTIYDSPDILL